MEIGSDVRFVWRGFARTWRGGWWLLLVGALVLGAVTGAVLFPNDLRLMRWVQGPEGLERIGQALGFWGDFLQFNVAWAAVIWAVGAARRDRWLRRVALVLLLGGALGGATARVVKISAGRARPPAVEQQELPAWAFTGLSMTGKYHSYVSGHTAATFGSAVALAIVLPRVGWVAVLFAAAVGWSRMYGNHHFPSDVVHGAIWGAMWGLIAGWGMGKVRKRARRMGTRVA